MQIPTPVARRMRAPLPKPKAFKLRVLHGPQKFGVAGRSPEELLRKGCRLLQVRAGKLRPGPGGGF